MLLKNHWYAIEHGHEIKDEPKLVTVHSHDLVLWRGRDGTMNAQSDVCVHRGGSLGGGKVVDGCVECPYHGWRFDDDGVCVEIPANKEGLPIPKKARVDSYPCVERYGFVWVFLGDAPAEERPPIPELEGLDFTTDAQAEGYRPVYGEFHWNANYDRVLENAVDIAHTPFVHAGSFGNADKAEIEDFEIVESRENGFLASVTATVNLEPPPPSGKWKKLRKTDEPPGPIKTTTGFFPPNVSMLIVRLPLGEIRIFTAAVPIDESNTVSKFTMMRTFFHGAWADRDSVRRTLKIFKEDQATVEAQRPELLPFDLAAELHVKSDAIQLAYRRWRQEQLDAGVGIPTPRDEQARRAVAVIPSPGRTADPELVNAWVFPVIGDSEQAGSEDDS